VKRTVVRCQLKSHCGCKCWVVFQFLKLSNIKEVGQRVVWQRRYFIGRKQKKKKFRES